MSQLLIVTFPQLKISAIHKYRCYLRNDEISEKYDVTYPEGMKQNMIDEYH